METISEPIEYARADDLRRTVRKLWAPPPRLKVSEFADRHLIVTTGPFASARWQTSFMPYQAGILDAFFESNVEIVVLQASSQVGKTSAACVVVAYHIVHDPCPILVVEPTVEPMARDFSRNRLEPMIEASSVLRDAVSKRRAKDASNTVLSKTFKGGSISIGGANSAASLAARTIRLLLLDEIDRYPAELPGEGATIQVALKRTTSYGARKRVLMTSSPTMKGAPIDTWFHRGDQRRFYVPCPNCGLMHPFRWKNVRWKNRDPMTARLHCPECDYGIDEAERVAILSRGEWRPENPKRMERNIASFHLWEAYSPLSRLSEIVASFMFAHQKMKEGDASHMHSWINTSLGEPLEDAGEDAVETDSLLERREEWNSVPMVAPVITAGIDVQDEWIEVLVVAWGPGEESWLLDHHKIPGNTSQKEPWKNLDVVMEGDYQHESGPRIPIMATCIDSAGHRTEEVYDYAHRNASRRVFAIIGRDGDRPIVSSPSPRQWGRKKRKVPLYTIGVDTAKSIIMSRLKLGTGEGEENGGPGFIHLPRADWCDQEFIDQLTSEVQVKVWRKGVPKQQWKKIRTRNEALDLSVYALAALRLLHPNFDVYSRRLLGYASPQQPAPQQQPKPSSSSWLPNRGGDWWRGR